MFERLITSTWNRLVAPGNRDRETGSRLDLGFQVIDEQVQRSRIYVLDSKRCEHLAILGKTGQGKSFFLRHLSAQDVGNRRGFVFFDLHGDTMPFLLALVAAEERRRGTDLIDCLIVNQVSGFATDQRFRNILGQERSIFSLLDAMDRGRWVILTLDKGRLGEQASTLGSLLLTKLKNALFARRRRQLFTLYCDEIQNLVAYEGAGLDTLLSEARKFGASVCSANQFMEQYPPPMRAAILSVGTHIFFQLSST